ncbi:hypothetical protein EV210_12313 [Anaerospora hongkongensis]|uniref:Uncharacterized protein n=1 Tax=Anaerospora hongkongensis TaxID=244830 RepID=A0A4R1PLW9_9FIRM|nr:hypothetical protein [Anaerospora hongkongensis]TCL32193.1 hypothetical protein EV210_12313 [Anaerospora hongkongensis]
MQDFIERMNILLNRGVAAVDETCYFTDKPHAELIEQLKMFLYNHQHLLGNIQIQTTQALNDHGVDLLVTNLNNSYKVGFQIKSHFDVKEKDFSSKVKSQHSDSNVFGLNRWYLLICSPLWDGKKDLSFKVNYLINTFKMHGGEYVSTIGPDSAVKIFTSGLVDTQDFNQSLKRNESPSANFLFTKFNMGNQAQTLSRLNSSRAWHQTTSELASTKIDFDKLLTNLSKLSKQTRVVLTAIIIKSISIYGNLVDSLVANEYDVRTAFNIDQNIMIHEVRLLEQYGFISIQTEGIHTFLEVRNKDIGWSIFFDIKKFCEAESIPLQSIIVELNFSLFD